MCSFFFLSLIKYLKKTGDRYVFCRYLLGPVPAGRTQLINFCIDSIMNFKNNISKSSLCFVIILLIIIIIYFIVNKTYINYNMFSFRYNCNLLYYNILLWSEMLHWYIWKLVSLFSWLKSEVLTMFTFSM